MKTIIKTSLALLVKLSFGAPEQCHELDTLSVKGDGIIRAN